MNRAGNLTRCALGASALAALCLTLTACGTGSSPFDRNAVNVIGSSGQEFTFGALSGRAVLSNPPVTTNGYGATVTGLKGDIASLSLNDTSPNLAETRIAFHSYRDGN